MPTTKMPLDSRSPVPLCSEVSRASWINIEINIIRKRKGMYEVFRKEGNSKGTRNKNKI
jgi:hypothetical protein